MLLGVEILPADNKNETGGTQNQRQRSREDKGTEFKHVIDELGCIFKEIKAVEKQTCAGKGEHLT